MSNKIYISGKITGLERGEAFDNFCRIARKLKDNFPNAEIVNPMKDEPIGLDWVDYMRRDIKMLVECDTIFMQPNWMESAGAKLEYRIAKGMKMNILYNYDLEK